MCQIQVQFHDATRHYLPCHEPRERHATPGAQYCSPNFSAQHTLKPTFSFLLCDHHVSLSSPCICEQYYYFISRLPLTQFTLPVVSSPCYADIHTPDVGGSTAIHHTRGPRQNPESHRGFTRRIVHEGHTGCASVRFLACCRTTT